ncbi:MAG: EAL domain-containing protein, partial [Pseudomonadota bacterium]|nr:EAL domain-containing protein [Pseudomonadota bacterium]
SAQYESITSCSFLNIGYIDTSLLHNLLEDEIHEVIRVIEHKTNHLNLHSQELVNIYDFGQDVRAIISEIQENLSLKSAVIHSIENHAVELYFHSIVNVNDSNLFGAETLARIPHGPNGQLIPAGMFIDIVNDYGLYQKFDMVVIQKIRNHLKEVSKKLDYVFLNLNPLSLLSKSIIDNIKQLTIEAKQHNLNVVLELTEYTLTSKLDVLKQLQTDNFFVAVDDFGTGYTNFEIVKQLSEEKLISFLKIDGSLVRSICESETSASLLEVILLLGNKLNLSLVLEYIEDQKVVNKLIEMFDDIHSKENVYGQGWFFSKPETIKDFNI